MNPARLAGFVLLLAPACAGAQAWSDWAHRYQSRGTVDATYRLPFGDEVPVRVDQGPNGAFSHHDDANRNAIDFALPEGTPVLAARDGTVTQTESGIRANFRKPPRDGLGEAGNFVRIRHADGSVAVYAHLQTDSVRVRPGQHVRAGERIARSGNTGFSTAPHLHFAVQVAHGAALESVPVRIEGPLGVIRFPKSH